MEQYWILEIAALAMGLGWARASPVSLGASFRKLFRLNGGRDWGLYFLKGTSISKKARRQAVFYSCAILLSNTELGDRRVGPGQGGYNQWTSPCGKEC